MSQLIPPKLIDKPKPPSGDINIIKVPPKYHRNFLGIMGEEVTQFDKEQMKYKTKNRIFNAVLLVATLAACAFCVIQMVA